jgi:hypothetical protein
MVKNDHTPVHEHYREDNEQAHSMILYNRSVPITEVVQQLCINHGSALGIIQDQLDFHYTIIKFLDIVHSPVFYLKHNVSEIGLYLHLQVKAYSVGRNDTASPCLQR